MSVDAVYILHFFKLETIFLSILFGNKIVLIINLSILTESLNPWQQFFRSVFVVHHLLRRLKLGLSCWPTQPKDRPIDEL